jgi:hypothetical protein
MVEFSGYNHTIKLCSIVSSMRKYKYYAQCTTLVNVWLMLYWNHLGARTFQYLTSCISRLRMHPRYPSCVQNIYLKVYQCTWTCYFAFTQVSLPPVSLVVTLIWLPHTTKTPTYSHMIAPFCTKLHDMYVKHGIRAVCSTRACHGVVCTILVPFGHTFHSLHRKPSVPVTLDSVCMCM